MKLALAEKLLVDRQPKWATSRNYYDYHYPPRGGTVCTSKDCDNGFHLNCTDGWCDCDCHQESPYGVGNIWD